MKDMTWELQLYNVWFVKHKLFQSEDKLEAMDMTKIEIKYDTTFCHTYKLSKIPK